MSGAVEPRAATPVEQGEDPLYDAVVIAFVYAAWAAAATWFGDRTGLVVLVTATTVLTAFGVARPPGRARITQRTFVVDFGTILLYCVTTIALGVLLVDALA